MSNLAPVAAILAFAAVVIFAPRDCPEPEPMAEARLVPVDAAERPALCDEARFKRLCWMASHGPEEAR